ncbi:MAG TPA: redoxin domain-containing protein [Planctomycetota bacterium]|nr:redoxin domain-containing protein [Planctomycetota bacterium]
MRCHWTCFGVAVLVLFWATTLTADEAEDLYEEIRKAGDEKITQEGKSHEAYRDEAVKHFESIIDKCEQYKKRHPAGTDLAAVLYEQGKSYYYLSRFKEPRRELLAKGAELARKVIAMDRRTDAAGRSRGLLIQYCKMTGKNEELIEHAEAVVQDFPDSDFAPLALSYIAETYEGMGKEVEAVAAYERLTKTYEEHPYALRAAGILRFKKLKGTVMDLEFIASDGKEIKLSDYRGKVVVIAFWASWHEPCRSSAPVLVKIEKTMHDRGVRVIGISLDKDKDAMEKFAREIHMTWPQYFDGKKWENKIARHWGIRVIPARLLVDKSGKVCEVNPDDVQLQAAIRKLLDEPGP